LQDLFQANDKYQRQEGSVDNYTQRKPTIEELLAAVIAFISGKGGSDETRGIASKVTSGASNLLEKPDQQGLGLYLGKQERCIDRATRTVDSRCC
jgi:hypothetical protein